MNSTQNVGVFKNKEHTLLWFLQKIEYSQRVGTDQTFFAFFADFAFADRAGVVFVVTGV